MGKADCHHFLARVLCVLLLIILLFNRPTICSSRQEHEEQQWPCGDGNLRFASYYEDHMVLQKSPERALLWGCGPLGEQVTVYVQGPNTQQTLATVSDESGMWRVMLAPVEAGGPYNITAALTNLQNTYVTLVDVLFGDVWLCSGQSNMFFKVLGLVNASGELALASKYPHVRFFMVGLVQKDTELLDLTKVDISWSVPNEKNLASFSALCWLFGRYLYNTLQYPIGLVESSWGGTPVEAWSSHSALRKCGLDNPDENSTGPISNSVLWNAMIHPLLNLTIKGAIWYQGESNADYHRDLYNCTFPAMIDSWRMGFHEGSGGQTAIQFPFGFVQLSTYKRHSTDDGFPEIRWHQTADYGFVPNPRMMNTFMAVAMDLPDETSPYGTIHPRYKEDVAYRLTLGAKALAYNYSLTFHGPFPDHILPQKLYVNLTFDQQLSVTPSTDIFEICCSASISCGPRANWVSAPIITWDQTTIQLSTESCPDQVAAVRYAWTDWPCDFKACPVYGSNTSLPAPPFVISLQQSFGWKRNVATNRYFNTDGQKVHDGVL
ncbi:sialate O-acetylesterase [Periophthalmus magnuspinnatus]|uniref:sialate O-acetylesterase n=1 Tax=Periophthalmus magnuspinnatus TaxID=409849 RepID=UPI0024369A8D|nr:sialate O-acetylesterase [Periophthalmus magnuspinnatus]